MTSKENNIFRFLFPNLKGIRSGRKNSPLFQRLLEPDKETEKNQKEISLFIPPRQINKPRYFLNLRCKQLDGRSFWYRTFVNIEKTIYDTQDLYEIEKNLIKNFVNKDPDNPVMNITIKTFTRVEERFI